MSNNPVQIKTRKSTSHDYPKTRKASSIVKCPHCSHTGSSRGLFQHVRMAHNDITAKPPTSTYLTAHPLDVKGLGHIKEKVNSLDKSTEISLIEVLVVPLAIAIFKKMAENFKINTEIERMQLASMQSEFINSSAIGSVKKPKRKLYGER